MSQGGTPRGVRRFAGLPAARLSVAVVGVAAGVVAVAVALAAAGHSAPPQARASPALVGGLSLVGQTGGPVRAVVAVTGTAWIGQGMGVTAVDVRRPDDPRQQWHLVLGDSADVWGLAMAGDYLVAASSSGVYSLDPSGEAPRVVGHVSLGQPVRAIAALAPDASGAVDLVATAPGTDMTILQLAHDGTLGVAGSIPDTAGVTVGAAVDGRRALVAQGGVRLVDLTDPAAPVTVAQAATGGVVRGMAARDGLAYVADSEDGLTVFAMAPPLTPQGSLAGVSAGRLVLDGDLLFLLEEHAAGPTTVRLIDVADPAHPRDVLGGESTYEILRGTFDMAVVGSTCVAARGSSLAVVDVRDVLWPLVQGALVSEWPVLDVAPAGDCVYVAEGATGLGVIDVRQPDTPTTWAEWRPQGGVFGVHIRDGFAYVSGSNGFSRIDVHDPCDPMPREVPFAADWPATSWIDSNGALLAATTADRLHLARISAAAPPEPLQELSYGNELGWPPGAVAQGVALYPDVAYVAAGTAGLGVVAVDGDQPRLIRMVPTPEGLEVFAVAVSGDWLAAGTSDGVLVYDLASPQSPRLVGALSGSYAARDLAFPGLRRLFVAADADGLLALDLEDPAHPVLRADWRPPFSVSAVGVDGLAGDPRLGGFVYAAADGLDVLTDLSAAPSPTAGASATPSVSPATASATSTATLGATSTATSDATSTATSTASATPAPTTPGPSPWRARILYVPALVQGVGRLG